MVCSSSNRNSASARASSVLPTPVGPLSNAYLINPVLNAERANLRATDEQNPELEYLGLQIQLVTAKRDRVVAEYAL
jgi:hypothetical protein